ncbi:3',5'-cyclic-AMP phosphodiesterase [Gammaproteobacteria bacterium]|nr:3',5'-cyclic-AMP phosphodiesterase [Gammaproteobacteria bacterium]
MYDSNEASYLTLKRTDPAIVRLIQITDCHILARARDCLQGMNTRASFEAVCQAAMADNSDLDLILATGDLSQDASPASYQYLAQKFNELQLPLFWLPGNHDDSNAMREHLRGERISAAKQVLIGNWLIVLLDSTIEGETGGKLSSRQIDFLQASLQGHPDQHALVCLHHQALPANSEWMDQLGLQQPQALIDTLKSHDNVRAVLWGHVHQQAHHHRDGIEWMSTPSTCVQFKPGSKTFALDDLPPGYRRINLNADGSIDTSVLRLRPSDRRTGTPESDRYQRSAPSRHNTRKSG